MELKDFIEKITDVFDETDASEITPSTSFKELEEWSSLTALSIIAMVDEEYGISLNGGDIQKANSIEDIYKTIQAKGNES